MNESSLETLISNIKILKSKEFSFGIEKNKKDGFEQFRVKQTNDVVFYNYQEAREVIEAIQNLFREV